MLYVWKDKKHLTDALKNVALISLLSFSLILPILLIQSNMFSNLGYTFNFSFYDEIIGYLVTIVSNIAIVTIWEEMLFRGYLQNFLLNSTFKKLNRFKGTFSVVASSFVFMIFHIFTIIPSPLSAEIRLLSVFIFGLFLGYNLLINKNLWLNIVIHANLNFEINKISSVMIDTISSVIKVGSQNFNMILNKINACAQSQGFNLTDCIKNAVG